MFAVGMIRGKAGIGHFEVPMPEIRQPDEVLVRVKEVGLDGTDFAIARYGLNDMAKGENRMIMGHEMVGVVEEVGEGASSLAPGDPVVITVRCGCGICQPCRHNESDMCMTGLFSERGIHKLDGFLTRFTVAKERYVVKVPAELVKLAIFTEPLSIAEKAIEQITIIQSRLIWTCSHTEHAYSSEHWGDCKTALVVGAGPLGLLATALLRLNDVNTYTSDILPDDHPRAQLSRAAGTHYIDARGKTPDGLARMCYAIGNLDIIFEAAGAAATAVELINCMSRSSIYVMTGIPQGDLKIEVDAASIVSRLVRQNQVVVGSVNSNRTHFEKALKDIPEINSRFTGMLDRMITHRFRLEDYQQAFTPQDTPAIKTVIEVEPWD